MFSRITLLGRLGRDAAIRESQSGKKFISFTMAVTTKSNGVEETQWFDVLINQNYERYKNMALHLTKGSMVYLTGDFKADLETGTDGVQRLRRSVFCDYVTFAGGGVSGNTENNTTKVAAEKSAPAEAEQEEDMPRNKGNKPKTVSQPAPDDDLPF